MVETASPLGYCIRYVGAIGALSPRLDGHAALSSRFFCTAIWANKRFPTACANLAGTAFPTCLYR
jgi:hypothetical protein